MERRRRRRRRRSIFSANKVWEGTYFLRGWETRELKREREKERERKRE